MPIFEQSYRSYEGQVRQRGRWLIVLEQELRVLVKSRIFLVLLLGALIHTLLRLLQVVAYDIVMQNPNHPLTPLLSNIEFIRVGERTFFDFVRIQSPLILLIILYAGAGMIGNDMRNNLMEIYFSKPLNWRDYVLGKVLTLVLLGLAVSALPGIILIMLHNIFMASWEVVLATWWWIPAVTAFSLAVVLPAVLTILACSAIIKSERYAAITVFMLVLADSGMGVALAEMLRDRDYQIISFPLAVNRLGQAIFQTRQPMFDLHWGWCVLFIAGVCLAGLFLVAKRARRAEYAA